MGFELWAGNTIEHSKLSGTFCGRLEDRNVESSANEEDGLGTFGGEFEILSGPFDV